MDIDINYEFEEICYSGNKERIKEYIDKYKINVNHDDSIMSIIISFNDLDLFKLFIDYGYDITVDDYHYVALMAFFGYTDLLIYSLNNFNVPYKTFSLNTSLKNNEQSYKIINDFYKI